MIGKIAVNFARLDVLAGNALGLMHGVSLEARKQFIFPMDTRYKISALSASVDGSSRPVQAADIQELARCYGKWAGDRNLAAHGIDAVDGIWNAKKSKMFDVGELPGKLTRSEYLATLALRILMLSGPGDPEDFAPLPPLPDRPE